MLIRGLHTQVLSKTFNKQSIHAEVVYHDRDRLRMREAKLCTPDGKCRTYAITRFTKPEEWTDEILEIDGVIEKGGLIGETFTKHGYTLQKDLLGTAVCEIPEETQRIFETTVSLVYANIIDHTLKKGWKPQNRWPYGITIEIYSPGFWNAVANGETAQRVIYTSPELKDRSFVRRVLGDLQYWLIVTPRLRPPILAEA